MNNNTPQDTTSPLMYRAGVWFRRCDECDVYYTTARDHKYVRLVQRYPTSVPKIATFHKPIIVKNG